MGRPADPRRGTTGGPRAAAVSPKHASTWRSELERYWLPRWGSTPLNELEPVAVEDWLLELELSNQSRNHLMSCGRIVTRDAARRRVISHDVLAGSERFGVHDRKTRDVFTQEEVRAPFPADLQAFGGGRGPGNRYSR